MAEWYCQRTCSRSAVTPPPPQIVRFQVFMAVRTVIFFWAYTYQRITRRQHPEQLPHQATDCSDTEIWVSRGDVCVTCGLVGCDAMCSYRWLGIQTFRRTEVQSILRCTAVFSNRCRPASIIRAVSEPSQVQVTLQLTVSQPVSLGVEPLLGLITRFYLCHRSDCYGPCLVGRPIWRGAGCHL
jgi:hypothetical protein